MAVIRQLKSNEAIPPGEPKRYRSSHGYVRLRWRIAPGVLVEAYEHRVVAGILGTSLHVHHRNGVKDANSPENLQPLNADEHRRLHRTANLDVIEAKRLYSEGQTLTALAERYGLNSGALSRILRRHGQVMRLPSDYQRVNVSMVAIRHLYDKGLTASAIARELGVSNDVVGFRMKEMGLPPRRPGRPFGQHAPNMKRLLAILNRSKRIRTEVKR